ncbi:hypothetical protein LGV61_08865 [Desulfurispirillum indicum]|uniref:transglycosylase SLT domain-containing protein n=1 Tax=Desulfurispirillum indicum TaxID=936456 RepID=UPI001CFB2673|nr:hypothetical protein [Desulfurispirillum indicum]UCZ55834.1 hypothetical protein LGV61_08865 [Desulfurispirillum indicum]
MLIFAALVLLGGCAAKQPKNIDNICAIFDQKPHWYDYAKRAESRWGTPPHVQMAIMYQESSFRHNVRPAERTQILGVIPGPRRSSAFGYPQAKDEVWREFARDTNNRFADRRSMKDALDFIGYYNDISHRRLRISKSNAEHLYLAYHEGHGGYQRRTYQQKPWLMRTAKIVGDRAKTYERQLASCESRFKCRRFYQIWPFCR